jgi:predicted  nucleic acid-binding Zn-ribbon protein
MAEIIDGGGREEFERQNDMEKLKRRLVEYEQQWNDMHFTICKLEQDNTTLRQQLSQAQTRLIDEQTTDDLKAHGWLSPDESAKLQQKLKDAECYGAAKDHTATVFMNQVKELQAQLAVMREALNFSYRSLLFLREDVDYRDGGETQRATRSIDSAFELVKSALSTTAGAEYLARMERYEIALNQIKLRGHQCGAIAQEALRPREALKGAKTE